MKNKVFNTILNVNSIFQALSCLLAPIALGALVSWLLTKNQLVGPWIYVVLITAGVFIGLISMITFLLKCAETEKALKAAAEKEAETADHHGDDRR